jgi:hypothetical protein
MNSGSTSSGKSSAQTSNKPRATESESEFLVRQQREASEAISKTVARLKDDLGKSADPRLWTKEYPWATLAVAAVGGFMAASLAVPSKEQQALKRLARIEQALYPNGRDNGTTPQEARKDKGILRGILSSAAKSLQPLIMSAITGAITGKVAQPDPEDLKAADNPPNSPTTNPS